MRSSGTFLKYLEKRSKRRVAVCQLKDIANYVIENKFNSNSNQAIVFCNDKIKLRVRRNIYLKYIRKFNIFDCYLIYSSIIDKNIMGEKWETFFMSYKENGVMKVRTLSAKNPKHWGVLKIISGGQTGADMSGLMAGRFMMMSIGGTAPKNYMTEEGSNFNLKKFGVNEHPNANYWDRTLTNVLDADATIIFGDVKSRGSKLTIKYCRRNNKPYKVVSRIGRISDDKKQDMIKWLIENDVQVLNIAGNRESVNKNIGEKTFLYLVRLLSRSNLVKSRAEQIVDEKNYNKLYEQYINEV